jgi:pyruvate carboxylase
LDLS